MGILLAIFIISTHALREEGDTRNPEKVRAAYISTHALREEGDLRARGIVTMPRVISTHALREEGDLGDIGKDVKGIKFLPTPSARRATG